MNIKHFSGKEPIVYVSPAIKELSLCFEGGEYSVVVSMEITTLKFSIEKIWRTFKQLQ